MPTENLSARFKGELPQRRRIVHNAPRPELHTEKLDALPFATGYLQTRPEIERYNVPFLLHPYVSFYTTRGGLPALCTFCMWPQTISGHAGGRDRRKTWPGSEASAGYFPQMKEIFFDDDTFNIRKDRVLDL